VGTTMQSNFIEKSRIETKEFFRRENVISESREEFLLDGGKYRVVKNCFRQTKIDCNWISSEVEVFDRKGNLIKSVLIDDSSFFHHFLMSKGNDYLIFSEVLCGGYSVLNLNTGELAGFCDGQDGFICTSFYPSSNTDKLAVSGCWWGTPYYVLVFNIQNIELLPWAILKEIALEDSEELELQWHGDELHIFSKVNERISFSRKFDV